MQTFRSIATSGLKMSSQSELDAISQLDAIMSCGPDLARDMLSNTGRFESVRLDIISAESSRNSREDMAGWNLARTLDIMMGGDGGGHEAEAPIPCDNFPTL